MAASQSIRAMRRAISRGSPAASSSAAPCWPAATYGAFGPSPAPREREGPDPKGREGEGRSAATPSPGSLRSPPSPAVRERGVFLALRFRRDHRGSFGEALVPARQARPAVAPAVGGKAGNQITARATDSELVHGRLPCAAA